MNNLPLSKIVNFYDKIENNYHKALLLCNIKEVNNC